MKKFLLLIFYFIFNLTKAQDPSFSQFDLNMIYMNPAFSGYEGGFKSLSHSRNQWNTLNDNMNTSIFELSGNRRVNPNNRLTKTSWGPGLTIIKEDIGLSGELSGNLVFIQKTELMVYPLTFHMKNFVIRKNKFNNNWSLSFGPGIGIRKYRLNHDFLVFSDQWSEYGVFNDQQIAPTNTFIDDKIRFDLSYGLIITRNSKFQGRQNNRFIFGSSLNHINTSFESFSGVISDNSKIPMKNNIHAEWMYGFNKANRPIFPYVKTLFRHERYLNRFKDIFTPIVRDTSVIAKTEFGTTAFLNNSSIEFGLFYRVGYNYLDSDDSDLKRISWRRALIPLIRGRFKAMGASMTLSYSRDINIASKTSGLINNYTGPAHEIGLQIHMFPKNNKSSKWSNPTDCPAFMENQSLYDDIFNEGLYNNKKPKKNFKIR